MTTIPFIRDYTYINSSSNPIRLASDWIDSAGSICIDNVILHAEGSGTVSVKLYVQVGTIEYPYYATTFGANSWVRGNVSRIFLPGRARFLADFIPAPTNTLLGMTIYGYTQGA